MELAANCAGSITYRDDFHIVTERGESVAWAEETRGEKKGEGKEVTRADSLILIETGDLFSSLSHPASLLI